MTTSNCVKCQAIIYHPDVQTNQQTTSDGLCENCHRAQINYPQPQENYCPYCGHKK